MNFLAHIYLSGENPLIKIGNFMGDFVKGSSYRKFPTEIQIGILLHRSIDSYTDAHPIFRSSKRIISDQYNHFSGIIIDMFYDHFLAKNWDRYANISLEDFSQNFYNYLEENYEILNNKTQSIVPHLIRGNWLVAYRDIDHLGQILGQMDQRFSQTSNMKDSITELIKNYDTFENHFHLFFKEIIEYCEKKRQKLFHDFY